MAQLNLLNMKLNNLSSMFLIMQFLKKKDRIIVFFITLKLQRLLKFGCDRMQTQDF